MPGRRAALGLSAPGALRVVTPKTPAVRALAPAAALLLAGGAEAQLVSPSYEPAPLVQASDVLAEQVLRSPAHRVDERVEIESNFLRFHLESAYGSYRPGSVALLKERVHEVRTLAEAISQYQQVNRELAESLRGRLYVGGDATADIPDSPVDTASQLAGQFTGHAVDTLRAFDGLEAGGARTEGGRSTPPGAGSIFMAHKRSIANLYGLDVYSTNPRVQEFLSTVARQRSAGRFTAGAATLTVGRRDRRPVASGSLDQRLASRIKDNDVMELYALVEDQLGNMGVPAGLRARFLAHPRLSPRHKAAIAAHLAYLQGVGNRSLLVESALAAQSERDALSYEELARMLALYHDSLEKLSRLESGGAQLPHAVTRSKALVVGLPVDVIYWSREAQTIFDAFAERADVQGYTRREVMLSGIFTETAKRQLRARVFDHRERFLTRR